MEVQHMIKRLGYRPKRTIRCVLFMNEENGMRAPAPIGNGRTNGEYHMSAIESDREVLLRGASLPTPRGRLQRKVPESHQNGCFCWNLTGLLSERRLRADISGSRSKKDCFSVLSPTPTLLRLPPHPIDGMDVVNKRELELGLRYYEPGLICWINMEYRMMKDHIKVHTLPFYLYLSQEQIAERVGEIGPTDQPGLRGKSPLFLAVLNGAFMFAADLIRACAIDCSITFIRLSYEGLNSSGKLKR